MVKSGQDCMNTFWIWAAALALYGLFLAWYVNWRGPLTKAEVDAVMSRLEQAGTGDDGRNDRSVLRAFLEGDDGREFFMLNVIRFSDAPVADPETGALKPAREVMEGYTKMFMPALFRRGGHPALAARKVGGLVDTWGLEDRPDWSIMGYVRYRSRRDMAQLVLNPKFSGAHAFKYAAMPQTFNFPTQPMIMTLAGPRIWVALTLALLAAGTQIVLLLSALHH